MTPAACFGAGQRKISGRIFASLIPSGDDCLEVWLDHLRALIGLCPGMKYYTVGISMSSR